MTYDGMDMWSLQDVCFDLNAGTTIPDDAWSDVTDHMQVHLDELTPMLIETRKQAIEFYELITGARHAEMKFL